MYFTFLVPSKLNFASLFESLFIVSRLPSLSGFMLIDLVDLAVLLPSNEVPRLATTFDLCDNCCRCCCCECKFCCSFGESKSTLFTPVDLDVLRPGRAELACLAEPDAAADEMDDEVVDADNGSCDLELEPFRAADSGDKT